MNRNAHNFIICGGIFHKFNSQNQATIPSIKRNAHMLCYTQEGQLEMINGVSLLLRK